MNFTKDQLRDMGFVETPEGWKKGVHTITVMPKTAQQHNAEVCGSLDLKGIDPQLGVRIRQSSKPLLNKLETEALEYLRRVAAFPELLVPRALTFRLANGCKYEPDIVALPRNCSLTCFEVKGPWMTDDSVVKIKMAATVYKTVVWVMIWKEDGHWLQQQVLP